LELSDPVGSSLAKLLNAIALYIAACAVLSLIATALMTDYTGKDIAGEYAT
jgi:hypothetical protein